MQFFLLIAVDRTRLIKLGYYDNIGVLPAFYLSLRARFVGLRGNSQISGLRKLTGLDPQTRKSIWGLVRDQQAKQGVTVFLTTRYMEEAATSDAEVILEKGRICERKTPDGIKTQYGKDASRLRFENMSAGHEALRKLGYAPERKADCLKLSMANSQEAL
ncbi:MAG: hypothetical protein LBT59_17555 [Clostridiales bacterium]|nr:hypothetical protein [Clostridiales bacterium]